MQKKSSSDQEIVVEISENDSRVDTQALNEEKCEKKMKMDGRDYETKQKILSSIPVVKQSCRYNFLF